jgi:hypothetical protein
MSIETIRNQALRFNILITDYEGTEDLIQREDYLQEMTGIACQLAQSVDDAISENYAQQQNADEGDEIPW